MLSFLWCFKLLLRTSLICIFLSSYLRAAPDDYILEANYPNPFNASTTIRYQLPTNDSVQLAIYNMAGQKIRTLIDAEVAAGRHALAWDGRDETGQHAASGVYFYQLLTSDFLAAGKMAILR